MKCDADDSPAFVTTSTRYAPYNSAISASASTSTASVWSDTASQSSDDTSISANTSESDSCDAYCHPKRAAATATENAANYRRCLLQRQTEAVPAELRQNPRRTAIGSLARTAAPPALVRQTDRKINFVDGLVGMLQLMFLTPRSNA